MCIDDRYPHGAFRLSTHRRGAATKLVMNASSVLASLSMARSQFEIALIPLKSDDPPPHGNEEIEFLISTDPGAPARALGKIASGGELSRISLAIGVVTANTATVASMVFDEVDVGIGGAVAEVVGKLLRTLSERTQVLCVTHLAQVASQGTHNLQVSKTSSDTLVEMSLKKQGNDDKVQAICAFTGVSGLHRRR